VLAWGSLTVGSTVTTRYLGPWVSDNLATVAPLRWRTPRAGTISTLRVRQEVGAGNGNPIVYTLRVNGVASILTVSMLSTANDGSDLINSVVVVAGDLLDFEVTKAADIAASPTGIVAVVLFS
jgi:hypothetical protein